MGDTGSESIDITADPKKILSIINDVESMPDRMDAFKAAKVLERDSEGRPSKAEFVLDARLKVLNYKLAYSYFDNGVSWDMIEGDPKKISGKYVLEPNGNMTRVTYSYDIDAGFPVPGFLKKQAMKMMADSALKDLKKQAEG